MIKNQYTFPKSSFLGMAKDTSLVMEKILSNKNVLKLIFYTGADWKDKPDLTADNIKTLFKTKQISNIPKIEVDKDKKTYLRVSFDEFFPNGTNTFYRDCVMELKILCHFDDWDLNDYELKPYRLAGELDSMFNGVKMTGIGVLNFLSAGMDVYDNEYGGITLRYLITYGDEDKVEPLE